MPSNEPPHRGTQSSPGPVSGSGGLGSAARTDPVGGVSTDELTLRVGCKLVYDATGPATLLLNVRPDRFGPHRVLDQVLTVGENLAAPEFIDSHGNTVCRVRLAPGCHEIRHDAIVAVPASLDNAHLPPVTPERMEDLPDHVLRYVLPSRYCDSDRLTNFAWEKFGHVEHGLPRVEAISRWVHENIEYRYMSGRPDLTAGDVLQRGYGVCRDFAHLVVALNRTFNLPARYVTGHMPDIGFPDPENHMDFHAYAEVFVGGHWFISDARFHVPRIGRAHIARGQDAVDGAFSTIFGGANLGYFEVWAYQIARGSVAVGDPLDFSVRLDNRHEILPS